MIKLSDIKGQVDFGILTIREDEFEAVLQRFPPYERAVGKRQYNLSRVDLGEGASYLVAVVRCTEQGTGEALDLARDLLEDLGPRWLLVVGIGGGVPSDEFTLGDVVVSTRFHDFSVEAVLQDRAPEYALTGGPVHKQAAALAANLPALKATLGAWSTAASIGVERPPIDVKAAMTYGDKAWRARVKKALTRQASRPEPIVTAGAIASSDRLIKDTEVLGVWLKVARQVVAVEMESAGVYRAAHGAQVPVLAIRGISDIVGFKRDARWTRYACHTAAAFAAALLRCRPVEPMPHSRAAPEPASLRPSIYAPADVAFLKETKAEPAPRAPSGTLPPELGALQATGSSASPDDDAMRKNLPQRSRPQEEAASPSGSRVAVGEPFSTPAAGAVAVAVASSASPREPQPSMDRVDPVALYELLCKLNGPGQLDGVILRAGLTNVHIATAPAAVSQRAHDIVQIALQGGDALLRRVGEAVAREAPSCVSASPEPASAELGSVPGAGLSVRPDEDPDRARRAAELQTTIEAIVRRAPRLTTKLVELGYGSARAGDAARSVARALIKAEAAAVARDVADLVKGGFEPEAARELLWHVLPLAGDWEDVVEQARGSGGKRKPLTLRLRTETIAEIVVARVEARRCLFAPGGPRPLGAASIPMPSTSHAPLFDLRGEQLRDAVLINLVAKRKPTDPRVPAEDRWRNLKKGCADDEEFKAAAAGEINAGAHRDEGHYLLVIDAMLDPHGTRDLDTWWEVVQDSLGAVLPGLRLVRLKGRAAEMAKEYCIVPHVETALRGK